MSTSETRPPHEGPGDAAHTDAPAATTAPPRLLLAGDIGGTSSRIALAPLAGAILAEAEGPGANLRSSGTAALENITRTVRQVLAQGREQLGADGEILAVALGVSGAGPARAEEVRRGVAERLAGLGIARERILITDDLHTAFLSGGVGDDGLLVLAGTGAVAVRFEERQAVARRDGMGWLLGDIGSAVWLGRRTLEAVSADLDGRGPRTRLTEEVGAMLGLDLREGEQPPSPTGDPRQDLIRALDEELPAGAPAALGRFARLPATVAEDPVAREILDLAVAHVLETVDALDPGAALPVVLAGSVLTGPGPLGETVTAQLREAGRSFRTAPTGMPGALLLARERAATLLP